ncbi:DNA alkylation repair protein [uncultured Roseibium sp.]|uniref:DNA alkylation repair protein n=1 Tax=uncultured Roseibium sp. TaxID=1936171 RepID=UPI0032170DE0
MATASNWTVEAVLGELRQAGSEENRAGMKRFGIQVDRAFGVPMAVTRPLAKKIGKNPALSDALWAIGWHEARILAGLIADPKQITPAQMDAWVSDFNSWDLCDQVCAVFAKTDHATEKIAAYATDEREFVRRAGFAMIAWRAVHAKKAPDSEFLSYLDLIADKASDPRNYVFKAVSWALRQIGKRSLALHQPALALAERLAASTDKTERRIGKEASRELTAEKTLLRLRRKS